MDLFEITFWLNLCQEEKKKVSSRKKDKRKGRNKQIHLIGEYSLTNDNLFASKCLLAQSNYLSKMNSAGLYDFLSGVAGKCIVICSLFYRDCLSF